MKVVVIALLFSSLLFLSCQQDSDATSSNSLIAEVQYYDLGPCCSNMELLDLVPVFSELAGYSETILAAVNLDDFSDLELEHGDSLKIQYDFSAEVFPCENVCNRFSGIPIAVISIEQL